MFWDSHEIWIQIGPEFTLLSQKKVATDLQRLLAKFESLTL